MTAPHIDAVEDEATPQRSSVRVTGDFTRSASTIVALSMTLTATVGLIGDDDDRVLVPFLDCWCTGEFGEEDENQRHSARLTLDNIAFVVERISAALREDIVPNLCAMSSNALQPIPERTKYSADLLDAATANLANAAAQLRTLLPPIAGSDAAAT